MYALQYEPPSVGKSSRTRLRRNRGEMTKTPTDNVKRHSVDVVPAPRLMRTIGATALGPTSAVAELVANSLDARIEGCSVRIDIRLKNDRIEIIDDARGMELKDIENALRLGIDMDLLPKARAGRMGTYGLGMKTAAASLGDRWGVITRPLEKVEPVEYRVAFDLSEWSRRETSAAQWTIELEDSVPDTTNPLGERTHGTVVWIEALRFKDHLPGAYLTHLSKAFAPFIKRGHVITVNGQVTEVGKPRLADDTYREFHKVINEERGWVLRGWVGLDTRTHNDGNYGIDLYRNDQLIEIHNKDFFKPHLMTSRIFGEAHLDFVPVNFNKVGFTKGDEAWKFAAAEMTELVKPVAEASRIMSRGKHDDSRVTKAVAKLNEAFNGPSSFVEVEAGATNSSEAGGDSPPPEGPLAPSRLRASGRTLWLPRGTIQLDAQVEALDTRVTPWDYIYAAEKGQLLVLVNQESAVFNKMRDVDFLACMAVADCIWRFLVEREKVDPSKARRVSNEWLHEAVTGKAIWQDIESQSDWIAAS